MEEHVVNLDVIFEAEDPLAEAKRLASLLMTEESVLSVNAELPEEV